MADVRARWEATAERLEWVTPWERWYEPGAGHGRWFDGAELNLATNLVHRHVPDRGAQPALLWEGEPGDRRTITYGELHTEIAEFATALAGLGVGVGDRVALHVGLIPEAVVAMLACAHLGAVWCILPAVLPEDALSERLRDIDPRILVTQDGAWRHGVVLPLKTRADEALTAVSGVQHTIVIRRAGIDIPWYEGDRWYADLLAGPRPGSDPTAVEPAVVDAEAPAIVTYVANRRGRPAGVVHTTAGVLAYCHAMHTDALGLGPGDVIWTPAEIGWLASQTHGLIGPLSAAGTAVIYEGMLDTPTRGRAWEIVERYGVHTVVATPSVVRALRDWADAGPSPDQVASLRAIVTAGEAIDDDTLGWLERSVGDGHVEVTNAWGQTELGGIVHLAPPLSRGREAPDAGLRVVDGVGSPVGVGEVGELVLTEPWPGATPGVLRDADVPPGVDLARPGMFVTGDRARQLAGGAIEFLGRSDRVLNISGQLVSATEIRAVLEEHPLVVRAEVVDRPDRRTGRAVVACIVPTAEVAPDDAFATDLRAYVRERLGGLAQPQTVAFADAMPTGLTDAQLVRALEALCASPAPLLHLTAVRIATVATD